ncbi:hypothetical protein GCM10009759_15190 [Kitasatospora saccharophila]|uniref:Uncharacterized protein n=1 Tax=Kitasatospora saccharophila TaxID=407973 RepID=A0ABP5I1V4_9ACTN
MAEELERKAPDPYHSRGDADAALRQYEAFGLALNLFLDAARRDLAYHPRCWRFWRRYSERRFQRQAEPTAHISEAN